MKDLGNQARQFFVSWSSVAILIGPILIGVAIGF